MREPGYYWVKNKSDNWEVAEFTQGGTWNLTGVNFFYRDSHFPVIDESRIIPPQQSIKGYWSPPVAIKIKPYEARIIWEAPDGEKFENKSVFEKYCQMLHDQKLDQRQRLDRRMSWPGVLLAILFTFVIVALMVLASICLTPCMG